MCDGHSGRLLLYPTQRKCVDEFSLHVFFQGLNSESKLIMSDSTTHFHNKVLRFEAPTALQKLSIAFDVGMEQWGGEKFRYEVCSCVLKPYLDLFSCVQAQQCRNNLDSHQSF